LRGKEVVVECKFDGDRIQVHKNGNDIHFFSRTFIDHSEFKEAIADTLCQNILPEKCILDGEMLVWDRLTNRFAEFGSNRGIGEIPLAFYFPKPSCKVVFLQMRTTSGIAIST
jgi:DNA ligase-4